MKIKTITCHHVYNHGAYLQAYALVTHLKAMGHDAEIINYRPDYLRGHFSLFAGDYRYSRIGLGWLYIIAKLPFRLAALKRKKAFDNFYRDYIPTTPTEYHTLDSLRADPPIADCYIAGSDQIWNTTFKNGNDPAFYLSFGTAQTKRISYAASFATDMLKPGTETFVKKSLENFDHISVREKSGLNILSRLGFTGHHVVDPVFLLSASQWDKLASNDGLNEKYVLIYDFERSPEIEHIAKSISKKHNLKIYSVGPFRLKYADRNYINFAPNSFLGLIKNAHCIISNSFHGSAFALIYHKDFIVTKRADGLNTRMIDLLGQYNLHYKLATDDTNETIFKPVDYSIVTPKLEYDITSSKQFLMTGIDAASKSK